MLDKETIKERLRHAYTEFCIFASPALVVLLVMSWPFFVVNALDTRKRSNTPEEVTRDECVHCENNKNAKEEDMNVALFFNAPVYSSENECGYCLGEADKNSHPICSPFYQKIECSIGSRDVNKPDIPRPIQGDKNAH